MRNKRKITLNMNVMNFLAKNHDPDHIQGEFWDISD